MYRSRVIPCLLLKDEGLYKTIKFKKPRYLGDPINTLKLFNDKEADEIVVLDISSSINGKGPNFDYIKRLTRECFMPMCYGGGVTTIEQVEALYKLGVEKVAFNTSLFTNPKLITDVAKNFGSQSVVASIDVKKSLFGSYSVYVMSGTKDTKCNPVTYAKRAEELGAGEIFINSIDKDGMMNGYDYDLIENVSSAVNIPVVAIGGAGNLSDCVKAVNIGASAAGAGSLFVYYGVLKAVLINYPTQDELSIAFKGDNS
ncbi:putative imidazole glycerol phosphate synthase subunit hisF2 [Clostridium gelidum]|uniref:Imidazole glycerol phosphate synthase subunit HisF n=1 Tax=Clostridium gelidum TaxID=704125 RepID=A0ABM7TLS9_9CLOT|nr:AglZ/HisF2 family acetamidino modification protein [Clostridium gelidum]BCZ49024.1 putative imidazole glycerol phosphate synthase subunit hisF2 [Clostridium gelidum]